MKYLIRSLIFTAIVLASACTSDNNSTDPISPTDVSNTVSSGNWRITYYWDTDHEETTNYTGYAFTFSSGGAVTAVKSGATTLTGNWSTGTDDSQTKLILNFSTPASFLEISDDWHVIELTATKIRLEDVSGGNGGKDLLTFEKN